MIRYRAGYKYQLASPYSAQTPIVPHEEVEHEFFILRASGRLVIFQGYAWDGASGPTIDTRSSMRPSLIHDVFCQAMRLSLLDYDKWHEAVDRLFYALCVEDGMLKIRAWLWYQAVKFANAGHPNQGDPYPIQEAP